MYPDMMSD